MLPLPREANGAAGPDGKGHARVNPEARCVVRLPAEESPILLTVVDTEEEFEWGGEFDRGATGVTAIRRLPEFQSVCNEWGVHPTYVVDYPVADKPEAYSVIRRFLDRGEAAIGAHLHPWVNPPAEEEVCDRNSFPGNLPPDLEMRKIRVLSDRIEDTLGVRPRVYKAGRYGLGPQTLASLAGAGFLCDLSVHPGADLRLSGGPDYSRFGPEPFWTGPRGQILELPVTSGYRGALWRFSRPLNRVARTPLLRRLPIRGALSRSGLLERLRLSPEGMGLAEHRRLAETLLRRGERVFTFSFHSTSLEPGCTSYVRNEKEQRRFLESCRQFFEYFVGERRARPMTPLELRAYLVDRGWSGGARP